MYGRTWTHGRLVRVQGKKIPLQGKKKQVNIKDYSFLLAAFLGQIIQLL